MKILLLISIFSSAILLAREDQGFPYQYTPEVLEKNWMKVRVEGQPSSYLKNPFRFVGYSIKAFKKKFSAPKEVLSYFEGHKKILSTLENKQSDHIENSKEYSISLVGDLMWLRNGWSGFLNKKVRKHFEEKDFLFGNLETLISKSHKVPTFLPARATFNSHPSIVDEFRKNDGSNLFSALSIANNHSLDYGKLGLLETLKVLQDRNIPFSGILDPEFKSTKKRWVKIQKGNVNIGFYAATYGMNNRWELESDVDFNLLKGIAPHDPNVDVPLAEIEMVLNQMNQDGIDIKIISLHWGYEYEYFPEPRQMIVAREIVKLGADIIMGHHSHSQQPIEACFVNYQSVEVLEGSKDSSCYLKGVGEKRKSLIIYGLGNFLTNMYGFLSEVGTIVDLKLHKTKEGKWSWYAPEVRFVYNERDHKGKRVLLFMDDYIDQNCFSKKCKKSDLKDIQFVKGLYPKNLIK